MRWYPVQLTTRPARIDVFGGTEEGWASLIVTVGSPLLVAAAAKSHGVAVQELPRDLAELGIVADLDATELAEVVAETMHTMNRTQFGADLRGLHTDLLTAVGERLSGPPTFAELVAGLQMFRRVYDAASDETLSPDEVRKLSSYVDTVGSTDQTQNELQALEGELRGLARGMAAAHHSASQAPVGASSTPTTATAACRRSTSERRMAMVVPVVTSTAVVRPSTTVRVRSTSPPSSEGIHQRASGAPPAS